jgi:hypothetical protein
VRNAVCCGAAFEADEAGNAGGDVGVDAGGAGLTAGTAGPGGVVTAPGDGVGDGWTAVG